MRTLSRRLALTPLLVAAACLTAAAPASAAPAAAPVAPCDIDWSDVTNLQAAVDACVASSVEADVDGAWLTADSLDEMMDAMFTVDVEATETMALSCDLAELSETPELCQPLP